MKKPEPTTPATQARWEALAKSLAPRGVELSAMFGMPALKLEGKAFGGLFGNGIVFKLKGDAHGEAMKVKGAVLFDPSGTGRAMKEWVVIPWAAQKSWDAFADQAVAAQKSAALPKKKPAKATRRAR
ncbi:MAG: hypothetical protein QM817_33705 [Archangium sp.]